MTGPDDVTIEPERFDALGRAWPGPRGPLSPLADHDTAADLASEHVTEAVREVTEALVHPVASVELTDIGHDEPRTWLLFSSASGAEVGAMVDAEDRTSVVSAAAVRERMLAISATTDAEDVEFSVVLQRAEAWVFGALLDLQRRSALFAAAAQQAFDIDVDIPATVIELRSLTDVLHTLSRPENQQSGVIVLADEPAWAVLWMLCGIHVPERLLRSTVAQALDRLAELDLVVNDHKSVTLTPHVVSFSSRFLRPQLPTFLTTRHDGTEETDEIDEDELLCCRTDDAALCLIADPDQSDTVQLVAGRAGLLSAAVRGATTPTLRPLRELWPTDTGVVSR